MNPKSQRGIVRDAIVSYLQDADLLPNLAALTPGGDSPSAIIGWGQGDLEILNDTKVAALGILVLVICSSGKDDGAQSIAPLLECPVTILITENVTINQDTASGGTGLPADYVAEQVLAALKNWEVPGANYLLYAEDGETITDGTPLKNFFSPDAESAYFTQIINLKTRVAIAQRTTP
jgi:hypothetical protein